MIQGASGRVVGNSAMLAKSEVIDAAVERSSGKWSFLSTAMDVSAAFTVISNTSLQITMPTGLVGVSGPIYVEKAEGSRASEDWVIGVATVSI